LNFSALENAFADNVRRINSILEKWNAMLMPTAAHPFMNPLNETKLWPHDNNDVYALYDKIFNSKGHGWSNLQSTHLNLPFYDDEEFAKLHAAIRIVLPLLPALCASSPILDERVTDKLDKRLDFYKTNQSKIPSITGKVIPEAVFSKRNYTSTIYDKIREDIERFDTEKILDPIWVNSRGAIPRFDRGSIEIRIMDVQECPSADIAIITLVIELLKALVTEKFINLEKQMLVKTETLVPIYELAVEQGQEAFVYDPAFLEIFGLSKTMTMRELWRAILKRLKEMNPSLMSWEKAQLEIILTQGSLSQRILKAIGNDHSSHNLRKIYRQLSGCVDQNKMFIL
jgi:carboxylate-amine ligase